MLYKIDEYCKHFSLHSAYFVGLVKGSIYRDLNTLLLHCLFIFFLISNKNFINQTEK